MVLSSQPFRVEAPTKLQTHPRPVSDRELETWLGASQVFMDRGVTQRDVVARSHGMMLAPKQWWDDCSLGEYAAVDCVDDRVRLEQLLMGLARG